MFSKGVATRALCTHACVEYAMASGVLAVRKSLVGIEEVVQLLTSAPDSQVQSDWPSHKAGEVYLYKAEEASKEGVIDLHMFEWRMFTTKLNLSLCATNQILL